MTFEWDPRKSDENFARRGFDFEFAALVFVFTDRSGEPRAVIRRIISARLSKRQERRRYAEAIEARQPQSDPDPGPR